MTNNQRITGKWNYNNVKSASDCLFIIEGYNCNTATSVAMAMHSWSLHSIFENWQKTWQIAINRQICQTFLLPKFFTAKVFNCAVSTSFFCYVNFQDVTNSVVSTVSPALQKIMDFVNIPYQCVAHVTSSRIIFSDIQSKFLLHLPIPLYRFVVYSTSICKKCYMQNMSLVLHLLIHRVRVQSVYNLWESGKLKNCGPGIEKSSSFSYCT